MRRLDTITRLRLLFAAAVGAAALPVAAETTPLSPAAAQPTLPQPVDKPSGRDRPPLDVRKDVIRTPIRHPRIARHHDRARPDVERPALAGVELVEPLPRPGEPPHIVVPTPAYPLDSLAAAFLTPPPPTICHRTARDPYAPDPHLYRESAVQCLPDNP